MQENKRRHKTNYLRRAIGVVLCLSPLGLVLISSGPHTRSSHAHSLSNITASIVVLVLAILLGALNFYLAFIRPALFESKPGYRHIFGIPGIGVFLVIAGIMMGSGSLLPGILGLVALLVDTGGPPWFLVFTWRVTSFWDA